MKRIAQYIFLIMCAVILALVPLYWILVREPDFISLEKRYREKLPLFNFEMLYRGDWGRQVDKWMADNMPAREFLVGVNAYAKFMTGQQAGQDVIRDRNGRLLEAPPNYDEAELAKHFNVLTEFADSTGNEIYFVIPPTAGYASKNTLPDYIWRCYPDDSLAEAATALTEDSSAHFVDLRDIFLREEASLFYRTDHHWNGCGAYLAYISFCESLGLEPLPADAFTVAIAEGFYGSTYAVSGLWLTEPDEIEMWAPACEVRVTFDMDSPVHDSMFFPDHLSGSDQYSVFLDGNHPLTFVNNISRSAADDPRVLLVIKDSYANSLIPLLIPHFDQIIAVDLRYYRNPVSELLVETGLSDQDVPILAVYSADHIVNDTNIVWIR